MAKKTITICDRCENVVLGGIIVPHGVLKDWEGNVVFKSTEPPANDTEVVICKGCLDWLVKYKNAPVIVT